MLKSPLLTSLAKGYGLDKEVSSGYHDYIPVYASLFRSIRNKPLTIVEIGIGVREKNEMGHCSSTYKTGNSLRCWRDYFPNAHIHGIDLYEANMPEASDPSSRIRTYVCSQGDVDRLTHVSRLIRLGDKRKTIDIIIDDGSHLLLHQVTSFLTLAKFVEINGLYIIEDVAVPYQPLYKNLTAFPEDMRDWIRQHFSIEYYDTRTDGCGKCADDFMVVFRRIKTQQTTRGIK